MNHNEVDDRIRAALTAAAQEINETDLRVDRAPSTTTNITHQRARWLAPLLAAAAVLAVAVGTAAIVSTHTASHPVRPGQTVTPSPPPSAEPTPSPTQPSTAASNTTSTQPTSSSPGVTCYFAEFNCKVPSGYVYYQPLWPFATYADEQAWQAASSSGGAQPWHLDAGQTALPFAQNYLGFTDITTVTSTTMDDQGAHIGVGYPTPSGTLHTAAVLHLVRYSKTVGDTAAGWEVVGSDDTDFSLEQPAYGSQVSSPVTVGGHITGVDENITVVVLPQAPNSSSGAGLPAGGQNTPWQLSVTFTQGGVLTIVASTGGHLTQHERFAIQGVHT